MAVLVPLLQRWVALNMQMLAAGPHAPASSAKLLLDPQTASARPQKANKQDGKAQTDCLVFTAELVWLV